ncbi:MAG: triose-phosphate isomerase family protein, partial [Ilumatobacteraceae bacterium]
AVLKHGMAPILCVGETLAEREAGVTLDKVKRQVGIALEKRSNEQVKNMVIAYEPIWAIGTGKNASPADAQEVIAAIRAEVASVASAPAGNAIRLQYGGSVKAGTIADIMRQPDIDGVLVGGASLDPTEFARIVQYRRHAF